MSTIASVPAPTKTAIIAKEYSDAGLCVLPACRTAKKPDLPGWEEYQTRLPSNIRKILWYRHDRPICIVTGKVSGNLEMMDFDFKAELYPAWRELVEAERPGLLDRLVIERSQSGGKHVIYRCKSEIPGNLKLAQRAIPSDSDDPIEYCGKKVTPKLVNGQYETTITLIETRGEGGVFLCAPSPGYDLESGSFSKIPVLTEAERATLIEAAKALNEVLPKVVSTPVESTHSDRPGDDYNNRGDVRSLLQRHGWTLTREGENEYWRRPGKDTGLSATLKNGIFYVFSSNVDPFDSDKAYTAFAVYTLLEHSGDFKAAAAALREQGYGTKPATTTPIIASPVSILKIGTRVLCGDRDNIGTVESDNGGEKVMIHFVSKEGNEYTTEILRSELKFTDGRSVALGPAKISIRKASELVYGYPKLRPYIIDFWLRMGEVMNVISAPKFGKSWFVLAMALTIAAGLKWLGKFHTRRGKVLLCDNELHPETLAHRLPKVAMAMGLKEEDWSENLSVVTLRGNLIDLNGLSAFLLELPPGSFDMVILDAWYRLQPCDSDENSNGDVTQLYNLIDSVAHKQGCAFICVHHSSKGSQSEKSVTDVGSGAGAQARAPDTHLIMRQHEHENVVVVDASVRSFQPVKPFCMRWEFPIFNIDETLNPKDLKKLKPTRGAYSNPDSGVTPKVSREEKLRNRSAEE
ncbi:MAG: hypothetical protein JWM11_6394, partial [Planctomycetaceae bacterium]|nr:hypothetical protein [Planctomycetaceae bacterium]